MKAVGYTLHDRFELPGLGVLNLSLYSAGVASPGGLGAGTGPSIGGQRQVHSDGEFKPTGVCRPRSGDNALILTG